MRVGRFAATGLAVLALAVAGATQAAERQEPITGSHDDSVQDAVNSPIEDLNLKKIPIPDVLNRAVANPYDLRSMDRCPLVAAEVMRLDAALGPDKDAPPPPDTRTLNEKRGNTATKVLKVGVEAVTPYRGLVRMVTGAQAYDKKVLAAIEAGFARRGFLKGMAMKMNCYPPASPAWYRPAAGPPPARAARRR